MPIIPYWYNVIVIKEAFDADTLVSLEIIVIIKDWVLLLLLQFNTIVMLKDFEKYVRYIISVTYYPYSSTIAVTSKGRSEVIIQRLLPHLSTIVAAPEPPAKK